VMLIRRNPGSLATQQPSLPRCARFLAFARTPKQVEREINSKRNNRMSSYSDI
jgi:hypothetical protein